MRVFLAFLIFLSTPLFADTTVHCPLSSEITCNLYGGCDTTSEMRQFWIIDVPSHPGRPPVPMHPQFFSADAGRAQGPVSCFYGDGQNWYAIAKSKYNMTPVINTHTAWEKYMNVTCHAKGHPERCPLKVHV